ncbi:patatin-like phospholipase family protein [Flavobacterium aciduliphilum]|uniref:NTE family protein n=1 Tax=Flavobacterium aciduliphilum TaxID=1101402 RepID=A0A328YMG0_9FLAO|nr:patatin-like phospholipase family protein [Flavobacterium aciduliphilum]RAR71276.1 NTE family protein [Flavobacterium aciduliphilum]
MLKAFPNYSVISNAIQLFFATVGRKNNFSLRLELSIFKLVPPTLSKIGLLFFLCFLFFFLPSQAQDSGKHPKVGLVLTGGGAKGFAHIGVLKTLEREGVKIDYIGGTSMGAVVGGLYAIGYNATQIDSIFSTTNFDELLQDFIPRNSKSFYEKRNDELYAVALPFTNFSLGVPIALSKGMYNYNMLAKLTHKVRHIRDFNLFPIPFVCVATDIETGQQVVLKNGYLPQALLASSAFPTLFSPVEIDGKILVDGGVINNYPIEEVKKMGADIIIGVDVQDGLKDRNSLKEATKILLQISNLQMVEGMKEKIKETDVYIKPDISDYSVISFNQRDEITQKGEEATAEVIDKIRQLALKNPNHDIQHLNVKQDSIHITRLSINDVDDYTRAYIIGKLGFKQGMKVSYNDLKKGINTLNATGNFSSISYQLNELENGDEFDLHVKESKNKTFLKFGLHYDGLYKSAALLNITQKKSLFKNDVLSIDFGLGDNFRYNLDYYVDNGFYFSFGFKSRFNQFNRNVSTDFSNGKFFTQYGINSINVDFSDFTNQAYLQTIFAQKFLIGAGLELKHLKIKSKTLENNNPIFENSDYASAFGYLKYDSFDNKYFPKKGWFIDGDIQTYLYSSNFTNQFNRFSIMKGEFGFTRTFYKFINLKFQSEAGFAFGANSVHFLDFVLGGYGYNTINNFKHFYGYDFISIAADSFIKSLGTIDIEFYKKNHVNFSMNAANAEDKLFRSGNWLATPRYTGYALGYGLETILGPIEVKYSWAPELPKGYFWVNLGFWF